MQNFFTKLLSDIEDQLQFVNAEEEIIQKRAEESYILIAKSYEKLQLFILKYKFKSQSEEIKYFKTLKPKLIARLIYFAKVYHIETKKPQGTDKSKRKYLSNELEKINRYFDNNIDFIRYYRSGDNYLDHKYFVRNKIDFRHSHESFSIELDKKQSTSFDFKIAKIMANDLLQVYLHDELNYLGLHDKKDKSQVVPKIKHTWTDSKTALIELIYALHTQGALDNGKAGIKEIANYFEHVFNIDLGDYYKTYLELRMRKTSRTKFLDSIKDNLLKRMDNSDDLV
ncbi:MAG: RteC domain-containing protein [Bacteroidota bacterium]|nr:RteC domain-containing protein [Bacteroidota bacterium]